MCKDVLRVNHNINRVWYNISRDLQSRTSMQFCMQRVWEFQNFSLFKQPDVDTQVLSLRLSRIRVHLRVRSSKVCLKGNISRTSHSRTRALTPRSSLGKRSLFRTSEFAANERVPVSPSLFSCVRAFLLKEFRNYWYHIILSI